MRNANFYVLPMSLWASSRFSVFRPPPKTMPLGVNECATVCVSSVCRSCADTVLLWQGALMVIKWKAGRKS